MFKIISFFQFFVYVFIQRKKQVEELKFMWEFKQNKPTLTKNKIMIGMPAQF